ncbi:MAG: hypothetical protein GX827_04020 [Clostridiales bacterium]|jgi:hypothetical protein|nr:hypothetical protein [Clostridiales bacterium]
MKKTRALVLILLAALLCGAFSACGAETNEINVTLIIEAGDDLIFDQHMKLDYENPTVLMLVKEAAILYELPITYNANDDSVQDIGDYKEYDDLENNLSYFWEYSINDVFPDAQTGGKANAQPIVEGDVIRYVYTELDLTTIQ